MRVARTAALVAVAPAVLLAMAVAEVVSYVSLERHGDGMDGMPTVAWEEFPEIDRELLGKFSSFDAELGWVPQPNTKKQKDTGDHLPGEEVENVVTYSTDEFASRVCVARDRDPDADLTVSTYGDSYCFCRGVDDDETFQNYLAEELDTHVANYGAGNYGLDQALLRLKKQYEADPTDYVLVTVTASSIARILSVWKHYQEFGNVLAVKPRFTLEDGSLRYHDSPVDEKEDLLDLESQADFLREHDHHYEHWFLPHHPTFPYTTDFFGRPDNVRYALYGELANVERRLGRPLPGVDPDERLGQLELEMEQARAAYHADLFDEKADLFTALVGEFVEFAEEKEFTPVFVMVQQLRYAVYEQEHGAIYGDLLDRLDEQFDELVTVDIAERIGHVEDPRELYVQRGEGGHYSPETNEQIAQILAEEVFE